MESFSTRKLTSQNDISRVSVDYQNATMEFDIVGDGEKFTYLLEEAELITIDGDDYIFVGVNFDHAPGLAIIGTIDDEFFTITPFDLARFGEWL